MQITPQSSGVAPTAQCDELTTHPSRQDKTRQERRPVTYPRWTPHRVASERLPGNAGQLPKGQHMLWSGRHSKNGMSPPTMSPRQYPVLAVTSKTHTQTTRARQVEVLFRCVSQRGTQATGTGTHQPHGSHRSIQPPLDTADTSRRQCYTSLQRPSAKQCTTEEGDFR